MAVKPLAGRALSSHTCFDMSSWRSSSNLSCVDYEARLYCAGGALGAGWDPAWGVLADWGVNGTHAGTACCACGGGVHRRRGCMSPVALNYDPAADAGDASCVFARKGCTDRAAMNYQPDATQNDDSCVYAAPVRGCTDASATNHDALAAATRRAAPGPLRASARKTPMRCCAFAPRAAASARQSART